MSNEPSLPSKSTTTYSSVDDVEKALASLLQNEPNVGKVPNTEEIDKLRQHKARVKAFLDGLPPHIRNQFKSNGTRRANKEEQVKKIADIKAKKKKKSLKFSAEGHEEITTGDTFVQVTFLLNKNLNICKPAKVPSCAEIYSLLKVANQKLHIKGAQSIYLSHTGQPIRDGDQLQNGDELLVTQSEPCTIDPRKVRRKHARIVPDYVCVLDFEATCDDKQKPMPQEIIEFPTLLLNVKTGSVEKIFHTYIKPDVNPTITPFCNELTAITQNMVDNGISLSEALKQHQRWLDDAGVAPLCASTENANRNNMAESSSVGLETPKKTYLYLTCGDWDLMTCLPNQLNFHGKKVPQGFRAWINIKKAFVSFYSKKPKGMTDMLAYLDMELEGRHHSGIDDCKNIARIVQHMLQEGWEPLQTGGI